ncbi:ATP-binding protein [Acanthopleuribacter pedis]|uniref:histidine kinase n=1 Tax=Acanthopleuribacter pedis TaxID=442870 RepID=A0A8J7Q428_9BACT|nr:ATP-binding protein [Acanthopleuribacter pedis]MBO1317296.1 response regulator [Acanthopleuribacter pedis]MBO1318603.1 response regulator [Acanthopleuribacter pedis]
MALFNKDKIAAIRGSNDNKPLIMLIDDEPDNLTVLVDLLGAQYRLMTSPNGRDAYAQIQAMDNREELSLIISDQRMPEMTGTELFAQIKDLIPDTVRIILTGYADVKAIIDAINDANIYKFMLKPYDPPQLLLTVKRALEYADMKRKIRRYTKTLETKVTERTLALQQKNAELEQKKDQLVMQEKMAAMGVLTGGLAHEFRNPLNFITNLSRMMCELVAEGRALLHQPLDEAGKIALDGVFEDLHANADVINTQSGHMNRIVDAMAAMIRPTSGQKRPTPLNEFAAEYVNFAYHHHKLVHGGLSVDLMFHLDERLGDIMINPQTLSHALLNLANNAIEAVSGETGKAGRVVLKTQQVADGVIIRLEDNGCGIKETDHTKVFEPFHTAKGVRSGHIGLGLSVAYDIVVKEHGGDLTLQSKAGEGTVVSIHLPA